MFINAQYRHITFVFFYVINQKTKKNNKTKKKLLILKKTWFFALLEWIDIETVVKNNGERIILK